MAELLGKLDLSGVQPGSRRVAGSDLVSDRLVADGFRRIRQEAVAKLEDIQIAADVLVDSHGSGAAAIGVGGELICAAESALVELGKFNSIEIREKLLAFNLARAERLLKAGRVDDAIAAWEEVLMVNPDNEYIRSKLSQHFDKSEINGAE